MKIERFRTVVDRYYVCVLYINYYKIHITHEFIFIVTYWNMYYFFVLIKYKTDLLAINYYKVKCVYIIIYTINLQSYILFDYCINLYKNSIFNLICKITPRF